MACLHCPHCKSPKTLIIDGWEYETETHDFDKKLADITIPKGWRLWTYDDCIKLYNSHKKELNLADCWFFIQQPIIENEGKYVAWFDVDSDRASLYCYWDPSDTYASLGVRLKRRVQA